jgi:hypothetical protein
MGSRIWAALALVVALLPAAGAGDRTLAEVHAAPPVPPAAVAVLSPPPGVGARVRPAAAHGEPPWVVIVLGVVAGALLLAVVAWWLARRRGWTFEKGAPARHGFSEAGYRVGGLWEEFRDWLRIGR